MKKMLAMIFAAMMVIGLTSCGDALAAEASPADDGQTYKLIIGSTVQDDSATGRALLEFFKPYVEEHSKGRIIVDVQNNSVLGGDRELFEGLQLNTVQGSLGPLTTLANFNPTFAVCDLPFLFSSKERAYENLDGEFGAKLAEKLPGMGMRVLAYGENAFRNISTSKKPIEKLEDLQGLKIRVMESPVNLAIYSALGCNPTPMSFSELYTGLQQGTVEGQDNGVVLTYTAKLYEVQGYYSITGHIYAATGIIVSEEFWQSLPGDLQTVLTEGALYAMKNQRRLNTEMELELIVTMEKAGMKVNTVDEAEIERFREAAAGVWDEFGSAIDPEIFEMAKAIRDGN